MSKLSKITLGILYWIWQLTWGALLTYPGLLITAFCIVFLKGKPHKNGFSYIVEIGGNWGGLEIGAVALCGSYSQKDGPCYDPDWFYHTRCHEFGHDLQQLIFGPLQFFIVGIPSICRYWYLHIMRNKGKEFPNDWYDSAWFEGTATRWGTKVIEKLNAPEVSNDETLKKVQEAVLTISSSNNASTSTVIKVPVDSSASVYYPIDDASVWLGNKPTTEINDSSF